MDRIIKRILIGIGGDRMRELITDPFYEMIGGYENCIIDYCLMEDDVPHQGKRSHKDAILFAMLKVIERYVDTQLKDEVKSGEIEDEPFPWDLDIGKAKAIQVDPASLLHVPAINRQKHGRIMDKYDCTWPDPAKGEQIPYWYAFLEPPHGSGYGPDDFQKVNSILFPKGTNELEAYQWTTDWSNYFDDGHEWWGTACWSIYDHGMNRYVVIMASTTD